MKTTEFLNVLKENTDLPVYFEYQPGDFVRTDYHLTEIKNVDFDTVDCGGVQNKWQEVHVQIWENVTPEPNHQLTGAKVLSIFEVVNKVRETLNDAEILFEYQNQNFHKATLPVSGYELRENLLIFRLGEGFTTCKAKDRATTEEEKAQACCGSPVEVEVKTESNQCSPNSGCC
ncbi:hypothetical protein SAMN04488096_107153 [Mesonia phycicola]|uniref:Uncharacterized protein n=1 Tax=Mesonia phycicola TaxID=579105 RepID=A0A1M6G5W2_9FLAO|nr:DUF6428 family protein [Mesonia phycicola]SHJ05324.1 hypothetical protein SAMN04488096_107153 [Mesonia phycicola]